MQKHLTARGVTEGPDAGFSMDPDEIRLLVEGVGGRRGDGPVDYLITASEYNNRCFCRPPSLSETFCKGRNSRTTTHSLSGPVAS